MAILPIASDCLRFFGVTIMLISVGIATRMTSLRKKGDREAAGKRIAELEARVRELEGASPPAGGGEKSPE